MSHDDINFLVLFGIANDLVKRLYSSQEIISIRSHSIKSRFTQAGFAKDRSSATGLIILLYLKG